MYRRKKSVVSGILLAVIFAAAAVFLFRDSFIVSYGIRAYRTVRTAVCALCGVMAVVTAVVFLTASKKEKMLLEARAEYEKEKEEAKKVPAILSMKGRLDSGKLREIMRKQTSGEWRALEEEGLECIGQMDQMDEYREKLHLLLADNDAGKLSDSEDVLDSAQQYICRNVRKVLNYMSVADSRDAGGVAMTGGKMGECLGKNGQQLDRVREFVYAMTEYLNHQGEDDSNIEMLEIYRNTILNSITEEEP